MFYLVGLFVTRVHAGAEDLFRGRDSAIKGAAATPDKRVGLGSIASSGPWLRSRGGWVGNGSEAKRTAREVWLRGMSHSARRTG